ncbi:unnamed protein product [Rotaria magnacalcarata]
MRLNAQKAKKLDVFGSQSGTAICCSVDTGLFVFYHAYKAGTDKFRDLFEVNNLDALKLLRRVFHLGENEGWSMARLFWLTENNLLKNALKNGEYGIKNTIDEIVFRFVKSLQTYPLKFKCTCSVCPKLVRETTSDEIRPIKTTSIYLNVLSAFTTTHESLCGSNLGSDEPLDYPADYMIDDRHPAIDPEIKLTHLETRYICQATRITEITKLIHRAPFIIANVENDKSSILELPDPLFVGEHE